MVNSYNRFSGLPVSEHEREQTAASMYDDDGSAGGKFKAGNLSSHSQALFEKGADALANAEVGRTKKYFGFKVDAGIADFISSIYNNASSLIFTSIAGKTYTNSKALAQKLGIKEGVALNRTAAVSTFGVAVALKAGKDIGEVWSDIGAHRKQRRTMARRLAPVLDEIKGRHSLGAFNGVRESDNEVIYAHRQRMRKISRSDTTNSLIGLGINAGPNLVLDAKVFRGMWNGRAPNEAVAEEKSVKAKTKSKSKTHDEGHGVVSQGKNLLDVLVNTTTGQVAGRVQKINEHKLRLTLQPYSALEMILELEEQVASNPKASSFQEPKNRHNPHAYRESYPLEEYVARVCMQHQKDMAMISDDHTEIREALHEELLAAVKPVAEAIRKGNISAMALVRLVGEGKIIKKHGRAIASPDDVEVLLERQLPKQAHYTHVDPKEYYQKADFSREELRGLLKNLQGEEKMKLAYFIPDSILEDAGMSKSDIKEMRAHMAKKGDRLIADTLVGLHGQSKDSLKKVVANNEIKRLDEAFEKVESDGMEAVQALKMSPTNQNGIEQVITNWAVPTIKGDKAHFGKVISDGHAKMESMSSEQAENDGLSGASHAAREQQRAQRENSQFNELD